MSDRFKFRVPVIKNNEFDGFAYINLGEKLPELHGGHYGMAEQCTGLNDKNGKLVYEGDIVRVLEQYKTNTTEQLYPMMFNEKVAKFGFKHPDGHFFYFTNNEDFCYEVIGNIHENANSLGEKL